MKKLILTLMISLTFILSINATQIDSTAVDNFPKIDEVLSTIVQKAMIVAEKTGDFIIEQSPLLLQEFYMWHIWSNILFIFLGIFMFLAGRYAPYFWLEKENKNNYYDKTFFNRYGDDGCIAGYMIFITTTITSITFIFISIYKLIYILIAPKLYLINYFIN